MVTYLADECVSMQTVDLVRASGMSVLTIKELGLRATVDEDIFRIAQEKHWVLITTDKGFGNIRTYPSSSHAGIIVIRAHDLKSLQDCHTVLKELLQREPKFKGILFIVDPRKYRKRQ